MGMNNLISLAKVIKSTHGVVFLARFPHFLRSFKNGFSIKTTQKRGIKIRDATTRETPPFNNLQSLADFILETENLLRQETRLI